MLYEYVADTATGGSLSVDVNSMVIVLLMRLLPNMCWTTLDLPPARPYAVHTHINKNNNNRHSQSHKCMFCNRNGNKGKYLAQWNSCLAGVKNKQKEKVEEEDTRMLNWMCDYCDSWLQPLAVHNFYIFFSLSFCCCFCCCSYLFEFVFFSKLRDWSIVTP